MQWAKSVQWLKLEIISFNELDLLNATVLFKAYFIENFKIDYIYEHSRFTKELGYWTYIDFITT